MSQKGMQMLAGKELLPEMKNVHLDKCTDCLASNKIGAPYDQSLQCEGKLFWNLFTLMYAM